MFSRHKVAAINFVPEKWNKAKNAEKLEHYLSLAAKRGCEIIVAPEGILEGYVISDVIWHRERVEAFYDIAEPLDGKYIKYFQSLAKKLKTCFCFGFARRVNDEIFNSAIFIDYDGKICGVYNKVSESTYTTWKFSRQGSTIRAFETPFGKCGILICSDRWYAIVARTLALDGAEFFLIPTYGSKNKAQNQAVLSRARENGVPVVQANVGANLIINRGEIVAYDFGKNKITTGFIDIPVKATEKSHKMAEIAFMKCQKKMQENWYKMMRKRLKKNLVTKDEKRHFISDTDFEKLKNSNWGEKLVKWKPEI